MRGFAGNMMIVYCIRHGESTYNAQRRLQGQSDLPELSELGRRQSRAAGAALAAFPIEAIYSSPLRRAMQTAQLVASQLGVPVHPDPRLKEIDLGVFQDRLRSEVETLFPAEWARWQLADPDFAIPGGESRRELAQRGQEAFEAIRLARHRQAVVVSHGELLIVTIRALLGIPSQEPLAGLENGSITTLLLSRDKGVQLVAFNQVDHLRHLRTGGPGDLAV